MSKSASSTDWRLDAVAGLNLGFTAVAVVAAWLVVRHIGILPDGTRLYVPPMYAEEEQRNVLKDQLEARGVEQAAVEGSADPKGNTSVSHNTQADQKDV